MKEKPKNSSDSLFIDQLKTDLETSLQWGESKHWKHQDFVSLSERIFEKTKVQLSTSTLKRVLGNLSYSSVPSSQTLNALAQFLDHENWLAYKAKNSHHSDKVVEDPIPSSSKKTKKTSRAKIAVVVALALALTAYILLPRSSDTSISEDILNSIRFSSQPVAQGFPNTVVFEYDVSQVPTDNIKIQQSWDTRKQFKIAKDKSEATTVYYYPGYWQAKLLVDGDIVKEHDIHMKTQGWMSIIGNSPVPRYLTQQELDSSDILSINKGILDEITAQTSPPNKLYYYNVMEFDDLNGDDLTFEVSFKNTFVRGDGICQKTGITLLCKEGVIHIPFSIPGCIGDLNIYCSEVTQRGSENNFSAFGVDYTDWNRVKCTVRSNSLKIYLNDGLIHELNYAEALGALAGLNFSFTGAGIIDDVLIKNGRGEIKYEADFNK
ncbi:hypothetical protein POV27_00345 [Aureisphaera galaxeae]|uniref:hypothetical protein n=1 Tax=Aureisphaera galaxeae TaxID=1538023 RepID=UPI0023508F9B|nr:hypothetical protein [Aureisphaera galaxeae]MDC8002485.1 hypothetical protein [Aureisphaera galaxeae]